MPKINIDELIEPIEVTVGGKTYIVDDIPQDTAKKMYRIGQKAKKAEAAGDEEDSSTDEMAAILTEILGADAKDVAALGMRRLLKLVTSIMATLTEEATAKNVPKAAVRT